MNARRLGALLTAFGTLVAGQFTGPPAASATTGGLPMGRSTYVVSMMDGTAGALAVRLATYTFRADGTVTERYWAWRQDSITGKGNVRWTKPGSGYTTVGCLRACPVRTPIGFQKGTSPKVWQGRWSMQSRTVLAVTWSSTYPVERWQLDDGQPGIVGARLVSGQTSGAVGWGIGSNARADHGVSLASIYATGRWITGPFAENAYAAATRRLTSGWNPADYTLCSSGRCLQGRQLTSADRSSWYHSYFAADAASDGRKVFWNNQTGVVQQLENPKTVCISASGGGHTNALLQALDDDGHFVGFVGVEASLNQRKHGQDVVASFTMMIPSMLSAIGEH